MENSTELNATTRSKDHLSVFVGKDIFSSCTSQFLGNSFSEF